MGKKEQIITIATKLFSERGFEKTPLSAVCEVANVSKGLIFHHFKSKDELLREIFKKTTETIIEINNFNDVNQTAKEKLKELLNSFFSQLEKDKLFFQFNLNMIVQPSTKELLKELIQERSDFILNSTRKIFDEIDAENSLAKSFMFISELDGIALNYLGIYKNFPLMEIKKLLIKKYL